MTVNPMIHRKPRIVASLTILLFCAAAASADEPLGQSLLRPDSLAGWDYGQPPPAGWTIADGRLTGKADSTPLLSGFSFGDFELRCQWSAAPGAACKVLLPEEPNGKGIELTLREGDHCGQITDDGKELAPGARVEPRPDAMHTLLLRRAGAKLSLMVDHKQVADVDIKADRRFGLGLAVVGGQCTLVDLRVQEPAGEPIFNGKDLSGWWCPGNINAWAAEDGELVLAKPGGGNYLRSEKEYANFTLSLDYRAKKGCNSGIGIRTPRSGWPSGDGMEMQIWDRPLRERIDKHAQMAIYGNMPPLGRADKSEEWNHMVVKADGWMISAWVNGQLVQQCNTLNHPELKHRHLNGWIGIQDHGSWIRVRDMRVLEAPDGRGLDAWYHPNRKLPVETAVIDRLMNPEVLSLDPCCAAGAGVKTVVAGNAAECVLADLAGPGAIVGIAREGNDGRLAFFFDGEERPRIECKPDDLWKTLPQVAEDANPVTTCLAFRKGLRIVLRDAKQATYRIEYLRFAEAAGVESFTKPQAHLPESWLAAAVYRYEHGKFGAHREHDPLPRFESPKKTIEPGKTETLLHVDGAGIVEWLKLRADKKVLGNNQLWLEVTIDGEATPAVSAPARFWFPGLAGQGNYGNFVLVDRGGPANRLAMPYGNGITIAARNCGDSPIENVGVSISVQQATEQTRDPIARRMRLRGVFQPAQDGTDALIRQTGTGRWIGLVCQVPPNEPTRIVQLAVDGRPVEGWTADSLDAFLGRGGDFRAALSGRHAGLCWRYLLLAPVDFQQSLVLKANNVGDRLALYYVKK